VLSPNSLYHITQQGVVAVALNSHFDRQTDHPHRVCAPSCPLRSVCVALLTCSSAARADVTLQLDAARICALNPAQFVLSLKNGDLYVLSLLPDGRGAVRMDITKAGASVLTSCVRPTRRGVSLGS
jgi:hypothetical protein